MHFAIAKASSLKWEGGMKARQARPAVPVIGP